MYELLSGNLGNVGKLTAVLCLFENDGGRMSFCSAGHPAPYRARQLSGDVEVVRLGHGLPLGIDEDMPFVSVDLETTAGDTFVLYTDGITEAKGPSGGMFREAGLENILRTHNGSAQELVERVIAAVAEFGGEDVPSDDLTLVAMRRT